VPAPSPRTCEEPRSTSHRRDAMTTRWRSIDTRSSAMAVERRSHLAVCRGLRDVRGRVDLGLAHTVMPDERTQADDNSLFDPRFLDSADSVARSEAAHQISLSRPVAYLCSRLAINV
jgi:hypothetical protein